MKQSTRLVEMAKVVRRCSNPECDEFVPEARLVHRARYCTDVCRWRARELRSQAAVRIVRRMMRVYFDEVKNDPALAASVLAEAGMEDATLGVDVVYDGKDVV